MGILGRYFATRFLALYLGLLGVSLVAIAAVEILLNSDEILSLQADGGGGLWHYLWLRLPAYYLRDLMPSCAFAAAFLTLAGSGQAREIVAMKAGGISPHRATRPMLAVALLLAGAALLLQETWVLRSQAAWSQLARQGSGAVSFRGDRFWYHGDDAIYNIEHADASAGRIEGIRIFELGPEGRLRRSIEAERGRWDPAAQAWHLRDGWLRHYPPQPAWPAAAEAFEHHLLRLPERTGRALAEADPSLLSLPHLHAAWAARRAQGRPAERFGAVLQQRLAEPGALWVLALAAMPLGLRVEDLRGLGRRAIEGVGVVALFFALRTAATTLAEEALLSPLLGSWGLLAVFAAPAALALMRSRR